MAKFNWNDFPAVSDEKKKEVAEFKWDDYPSVDDGSQPFSIEPIQQALATGAKAIDSYTGAPTRASIGAAIQGKNPVTAFTSQFGEDPAAAPTGKDIALRLGVPNTPRSEIYPDLFSETGEDGKFKKGGPLDITPAGTVGAGVDLIGDWTNLLPAGALAKGAGLAGREAVSFGGRAAALGGEKLAQGAAHLGEGAARGIGKGIDFVTKSELGSAGVEDALGAVRKIVNPEQAPSWARDRDILKASGIDLENVPESIEFGPDSFISRGLRNVAEGPAGQPVRERWRKGIEQMSRAIDEKALRFSKGEKFGEVEGGNLAREGLKSAEKELFDGIDLTHDTVQQYAPGLMMDKEGLAGLNSKLEGTRRKAIEMMKRGDPADKAQAQYLLNVIGQVNNTNGSYKQLNEVRKWVGHKAFPKKRIEGAIPNDIDKLRDIYFALNDGLIDTVDKHVNPEFAKEILENNAKMTSHFRNKEGIRKFYGPDMAPENVFSGLTKDTGKIEALKKGLSPEDLERFKGAYVQNLIKRDASGNVSFPQLRKAIENDRPVIEALFGKEGIKDIEDLAGVGSRMGPVDLSTSGTGASVQFRDLPNAIGRSVLNEKVIEAMKRKARGGADMIPVNIPPRESEVLAKGMTPVSLLPSPSRLIGGREGNVAQAAKIAQFIAAAREQRRRDEKKKKGVK